MVGIELQMMILPSFSDILRDVAMATNLVAKMGKITYLPAIINSVNPKQSGISVPQCAR